MSWLADLIGRNSADPRDRLELGEQFLIRLKSQRLPSDPKLLNEFCDLVFQWLGASNFKVSLLALEMLFVTVEVSGHLIVPFILERMSLLIERLGDAKAVVRETASDLLCDIASSIHSSPQVILEKILPGLAHRQWLVRCGCMQILSTLLATSGREVEVTVNKAIPTLCRLMADPNAEVREGAANSLAYVMNVFGPEVALSIQNRKLLPDSKLAMLAARCAETLKKSPVTNGRSSRRTSRSMHSSNNNNNSGEHPLPTLAQLPRTSYGAAQDSNFEGGANWKNTRAMSVPASKRAPTGTMLSRGSGGAGAVGEDDFRAAFEQVPKLSVRDQSEMLEKLEKVCETISSDKVDWDKRVNSLKTLRGVALSVDMESDLFIASINGMSDGFLTSVKDLRSQVVREACITISFFCERLGSRVARIAETVLGQCIALVQNSAKVMATSGNVASIFICRNVESVKLLSVLLEIRQSKSKEIRRHAQTLLDVALNWEPRFLEKSMGNIVDSIKAGICDADSATRTEARKAYQTMDAHFPNQAKFLFSSLDPTRQRQLTGVSQSSSSQSLASERDSLPLPRRPIMGPPSVARAQAGFFNARSSSAIDTSALSSLRKPQSGLRRPAAGLPLPPMNNGSPKFKVPSAAANSQPGSRSTSPTSTLRVAKQFLARDSTPRGGRAVASVGRASGSALINGFGTRTGHNGTHVAAAGRQKTQEDLQEIVRKMQAEFAMGFDENGGEQGQGPPVRSISSLETLSTPSRSASRGVDRITLDGAELQNALRLCASSQLNDKRDGLRSLSSISSSRRSLSAADIRKVVDVLVKIINESHHSLVSSVCDTISTFVGTYASQMGDCTQLLLQRLLNKQGLEIIPTNVTHYTNALEVIRTSVDPNVQLTALCRILQDKIMSPTPKVRGKTFEYLLKLLTMEDANLVLNANEVRNAVAVIFHCLEDQKFAQIRSVCERVICAFFSISAAEFSTVLNTFPQHLRDYAHNLLKNGNGIRSNQHQNSSSSPSHDRPIRDITQQMDSLKMSKPVSTQKSPYRIGTFSPGINSTAAPARLPAIQPSVIPPSTAGKPQHEQSPCSNADSTGLSNDSVEDFAAMESTIYLASDEMKQREKLKCILGELSLENLHVARREMHRNAMSVLYQMMNEGSLTLWDEFFKLLVHSMFEILKQNDDELVKMGLRLLTKICHLQAARFNEFALVTIFKVLEVAPDASPQLVQCAEKCARVLATHLPAHIVVQAILSIISQETDERLCAALKMLAALAEHLDSDEVSPLVEDVAPAVIQSINNEASAVRKASVSAIVALNIKAPQEMGKFISHLPDAKKKLVNIYIQRAQSASTHF